MPVFEGSGVQVWLPEAGGRVDFADDTHRTLMSVLGAQSERRLAGHSIAGIARMLNERAALGPSGSDRAAHGCELGPRPGELRALAEWLEQTRRGSADDE
ncbi:hypothetical protein [Saccharothrix stipae]